MDLAPERRVLVRFAWLSTATAVFTIVLKTLAWRITGSVGLLSDALESLVNLAGALIALAMLTIAARPADQEHPYGHGKAEYFSSAAEGLLISGAAVAIVFEAVRRFLHPQALEQIGAGLAISVLASLGNLGTGLVLRRAGRRHDSVSLSAGASHLFADVWTSAGVVVGVGVVGLTGWERLDPVIAGLVGVNVLWTGVRIVNESALGLMDTVLSPGEIEALDAALEPHRRVGVQFHALRSRKAGARRFVSIHVLVPGAWTVHRGHQLLERIEADIRRALPSTTVDTHLESLEDPASWEDQALDRPEPPPGPTAGSGGPEEARTRRGD